MHYKNGTPAKTGDAVIGKNYDGQIVAGTIHTLLTNTTTCNGTLVFPIPGGCQSACVTLGEIFSADDAFAEMSREKITQDAMAGLLYTVYCEACGGLSFNGDPLPDWKTFAADPNKQKQVASWLKTAEVALAVK
jgi:hypothetical protein